MVDADGVGDILLVLGYNNNAQFSVLNTIPQPGGRQQSLVNIASLADLALYRNISAKMTWQGGPAGPRLYAFEPSGYAQPYLFKRIVTQQLNLSFPGWKHHRRLNPGLISNSNVLFTILTQDGRTYGPYSIQSTAGKFRIVPQMLDQNIKDLAFAYQLEVQGDGTAALFADSFTIETKIWTGPEYLPLAIFKT